jgi:hypothetical protein
VEICPKFEDENLSENVSAKNGILKQSTPEVVLRKFWAEIEFC